MIDIVAVTTTAVMTPAGIRITDDNALGLLLLPPTISFAITRIAAVTMKTMDEEIVGDMSTVTGGTSPGTEKQRKKNVRENWPKCNPMHKRWRTFDVIVWIRYPPWKSSSGMQMIGGGRIAVSSCRNSIGALRRTVWMSGLGGIVVAWLGWRTIDLFVY